MASKLTDAERKKADKILARLFKEAKEKVQAAKEAAADKFSAAGKPVKAPDRVKQPERLSDGLAAPAPSKGIKPRR